ncbi:MAG: nucleotidyl transferase AbiEii/AbiGii toxin family protein [Kiritimatiellia bacterium]|jgi:predicted nucleotidyltransferase component of viral defense system|nr:nucleotidyl transferase AbiEii/AbiGii toxin family protein [Kiritimatiellia bacterium]
MDANTLKARFKEYAPTNALEQELALCEMLQEVVLASLSRSGFFAEAMFHGGTCLRIVHGMPRFSEDLDFLLKRADPHFRWARHLAAVQRDCAMEGIRFEVRDKSTLDSAVRKAWLKTDSTGAVLEFDRPYPRMTGQKVRIKLEVDTRPPEGSGFETHYLMFPATVPLTVQDLPSAFATKSHALLCRPYVKGRDWYDFLWFVARRVEPRWDVLANALFQQGPWAAKNIPVNSDWVLTQLRAAIARIDWRLAVQDVQRFLPLREQEGLAQWNAAFFTYHVDRLAATLRETD